MGSYLSIYKWDDQEENLIINKNLGYFKGERFFVTPELIRKNKGETYDWSSYLIL
jgi:hypothetical protein